MKQRKRFRIHAKAALHIQRITAHPEKNNRVLALVRQVRRHMTDLGEKLQSYLVQLPGLHELYRSVPTILTDEEISEAEYYRDKNSIEARAIYAKRQLDRLKSETAQEQLFFVSCALCVLTGLACITCIQSYRLWCSLTTTDQTRLSNALNVVDYRFTQAAAHMSEDPTGALVRSLDAYPHSKNPPKFCLQNWLSNGARAIC